MYRLHSCNLSAVQNWNRKWIPSQHLAPSHLTAPNWATRVIHSMDSTS